MLRIDDLDESTIEQAGDTALAGPSGPAADAAGSALVAEMNTHRIAFADAGSAWTRFGAHGSGQGQFARPAGAAFLQSGQLVVLDSGNCRVVALDDIGGAGWTAYGHRGRPTPGDPAVGAFADPRGLAVDTADRIWVSDPGAQRVVRMDAPDGTGWTEVGLPAGSGAALPYGIGAYGDGVALIDAANYRLLVLDDAGSTAATVDLADGTWVSPAFVCGSGNGLVVADVVANELRLLEPDGSGYAVTTTLRGSPPTSVDPLFDSLGGVGS